MLQAFDCWRQGSCTDDAAATVTPSPETAFVRLHGCLAQSVKQLLVKDDDATTPPSPSV
jgi:hypothetical protein